VKKVRTWKKKGEYVPAHFFFLVFLLEFKIKNTEGEVKP